MNRFIDIKIIFSLAALIASAASLFLTATQYANQAQANSEIVSAGILYLIDQQTTDISPDLRAKKLFSHTAWLDNDQLELAIVSSWDDVRLAIRQQNIKTLLIHRNSLYLADQDELRSYFDDGLMVVGVGIPGLELANYLGYPGLYHNSWEIDEGYSTPYYYYLYQITLHGNPREIAYLRQSPSNLPAGSQLVKKQDLGHALNFQIMAATDSLKSDYGFQALSNVVERHSLSGLALDSIP